MNEFIKNLETCFGVSINAKLSPETAFQEIQGWDSLALLCTIAMVDELYGVTLKGKEIVQCPNVEVLYQLVLSRKQN